METTRVSFVTKILDEDSSEEYIFHISEKSGIVTFTTEGIFDTEGNQVETTSTFYKEQLDDVIKTYQKMQKLLDD